MQIIKMPSDVGRSCWSVGFGNSVRREKGAETGNAMFGNDVEN